MAHVRCLAERQEGEDKSEWLSLIHKSNELAGNGFFGEPEVHGPWWAGGTAEEYPDARVIHRGDGSVSIVSKTEYGDQTLRRAAEALGIRVSE